ncbi:MAG: DUF1292 domain-containing protein [Acutalibacteraceae bacterium]
MDEQDVIVLTDQDGAEVKFELLDVVPYKDKKYVVLFPADDEDVTQVTILELDESNPDYDNFIGIEDDSLIEAVFEAFKERVDNELEIIE